MKESKEIINYIFKIWIKIYEAQNIVTRQFLEMEKAMKIKVKAAAAEFLFSNGLAERCKMIITNMLDKILEDQQLDLDTECYHFWEMEMRSSSANLMRWPWDHEIVLENSNSTAVYKLQNTSMI